jgi:type II secretory ATPase GspE/PulE/Tfp pilus assembly ATPase PilB-like protein
MPISSTIKRKLVDTADSNQLEKVAIEEGMEILRQSGAYLIQEGVTTTTEVLRVTHGARS